jgi:hypothetical protein
MRDRNNIPLKVLDSRISAGLSWRSLNNDSRRRAGGEDIDPPHRRGEHGNYRVDSIYRI